MNKWRIILFAGLAVAIGLLISLPLLHLSPWQGMRAALPEWQNRPHAVDNLPVPIPASYIGALLTLYTSGVLMMYLFPKRVLGVSLVFSARGGLLRMTAIGLLLALVTAVVTIGSVFSMGTFVLTFFLTGVLFISILFGNVALAYRLGRALLSRAGLPGRSPLAALAIGVVLLFAVINIPWIGPVCLLLLASLGLGAAITTHFGTGRPWSLNPLIEEGLE